LRYNGDLEDIRQMPQASKQPAEPSEYETFKTGLRQILPMPKPEIDRREADRQEAHEQKPTRKKKAA